MKVKLTTARCGHSYDKAGRLIGEFGQAAGQVVDMPADEAQRYLDKGYAVPADKQPAKK